MDANAPAAAPEDPQQELQRLRADLAAMERDRASERAKAIADMQVALQRIQMLETHIALTNDRLPSPRVFAARVRRVAARRGNALVNRLRRR